MEIKRNSSYRKDLETGTHEATTLIMNKFIRLAGIGLASIFAVSLIVSGFTQPSFSPAFWGVLIVAGLYRHATEAKPLNKYIWLLVMTAAVFSLNLQQGNSPVSAFVIAGMLGLLMVSLVAIIDFIVKPLWKRFGPVPKVTQVDALTTWRPLLITAATNGDVGSLQDLIKENLDVNAVDAIGATALMHAAGNNQIECMKVLLNAGADPSLKTKKGYTALWFAENNAHTDAASLLRLEN